MSDKALYRQALEIYQAQEILNSYSVEHDDTWTKWHSSLAPTDQRHLVQVAVIVARFIDEATNGFSEALAEEEFISEISERIHRKFIPSALLEVLGVPPSVNTGVKQKDEGIVNNKEYQDTDTSVFPDGDSESESESYDILETALDISSTQGVREPYSLEMWFESLCSEEQKVLQESTEVVLDFLPDVINSYLTVYQTFFRFISQDVSQQLTPLQRLWKQ